MYRTRNDLPEDARMKLVELLNTRLADAIDLQTQCKQAHWNVKGPEFIALHKLFDEVNGAVEEYVDLIAERAVQLGGVADGTARVVAKRSSLPEYPAVKGGDGREHVAALSAVLSAFGKLVFSARSETHAGNKRATTRPYKPMTERNTPWTRSRRSPSWGGGRNGSRCSWAGSTCTTCGATFLR